jgi:hypothetical protein
MKFTSNNTKMDYFKEQLIHKYNRLIKVTKTKIECENMGHL